ncbi:MAG: hypothetical protein LBT56_08000 [Prevotellaceae bacterium]|jgi:hypothetical protein|nr:hypothetical protein [Prevotellaceae bacterium]
MKKIILIFSVIICVLNNNSYANTQQINETSESTNIFDAESCFILENTEYYNFSLTNKLKSLSCLLLNAADDDNNNEQFCANLFKEKGEQDEEYSVNYFDNTGTIQNSKPYICFYQNAVIERLFDIFWLGKNKYL